jgi:cytochrome bd-type quinol oxidase subunit 2
MKFGLVFGVLTMATSFLAVGLALKEMYSFDFRMDRSHAAGLVTIVPIILYLIIFFMKIEHAFFKVLDWTGAFVFSILGVIVVLMGIKAKKYGDRQPEYQVKARLILSALIIIMFIVGFVHSLLDLI